MYVLVLNTGSSTLKFDLIEVEGQEGVAAPTSRRVAHGKVDRIGGPEATVELSGGDRSTGHRPVVAGTYAQAAGVALDALNDQQLNSIGAAGYRVVHGGERFTAPTVLTPEALAALEEVSDLAPLHNPPALEVIRSAMERLGPKVSHVAVFDTAFHQTLPAVAHTYALPADLRARYPLRRFGFHGIAHQYMLERYAALAGKPPGRCTIITLQLGNGCSACAIRDGRSVDTSMGLTPLEGLVMGTRSGDLDPGIIGYLARKEGATAEKVVEWLNKRSGLLGLSGSAGDMRTLLSLRESDAKAALAVEVFCYRVRKYIGAYMAALSGVEAVIFGGGIGENASSVRAEILRGMGWCGLRLYEELNVQSSGKEGRISEQGSAIGAYVVPVDEAVLIARQAWEETRSKWRMATKQGE